jgi:DNA (cytosine-5)-methyltransferase 1
MKILNLYAGIGGNRKLWGDEHEITAVENVPEIAKIYQDFFPNDKVIIADAHQYLLEHFKEFDFIWSSPPCPSHSKINKLFTNGNGTNPIVYPDMKLYEEILLLKGYFKGKWCVENVISWYEPLISPQEINNHYFWTNFLICPMKKTSREHYGGIEKLSERKGFEINKYTGINKEKTLRNCVEPEVGKQILYYAINPIETQQKLI